MLGEVAKKVWGDRDVDLDLAAKADREVAGAELLAETLESNHLGGRDGRIFGDVGDSATSPMEWRL